MGWLDFLRSRCPTCGKRGLETVQWLRATIVVDGKRAPASWMFHRCPSCGARFRQDLHGPMLPATDDDWRQYVDKR